MNAHAGWTQDGTCVRCGSRDSAAECVARKPLDTSGVAYAAPNVIGRVELKGRDLENIERRRALAANKPPATFNAIRGLDKLAAVKPSAPRPGHLAMGRTNPARDAARESKRLTLNAAHGKSSAIVAAFPPLAAVVADVPSSYPAPKSKRTVYGNTWNTESATREMLINGRRFLLSVVKRFPEGWTWSVTGPAGALNEATPSSASGQKPSEKTAKLAARRAAEAMAKR